MFDDPADEIRDQLFGDVKVRDHPVFERTDGRDSSGGASQSSLWRPNRSPALCRWIFDGDDRWFIEDDSLPAHEHEGVGSPQIYSDVAGKRVEYSQVKSF